MGDPLWDDYAVESRVRPLSTTDLAGLVIRYHTSRHYCLFSLQDGQRVRLALRLPLDSDFGTSAWRELDSAPFAYETTRAYTMKIEAAGTRLRGFIDGRLVVEANDVELGAGQAGLTANRPTRFQRFAVTTSAANAGAIRAATANRNRALEALRQVQPRPVVWKRFDTPRFGAGRNVRFGDLDGDGRLDMLVAQNVPKVRGDAFDHISCLTAVTLDGSMLWQQGRPILPTACRPTTRRFRFTTSTATAEPRWSWRAISSCKCSTAPPAPSAAPRGCRQSRPRRRRGRTT